MYKTQEVDRRSDEFKRLCVEYHNLVTLRGRIVPVGDAHRLDEKVARRAAEIREMLGLEQHEIIDILAKGFREDNESC